MSVSPQISIGLPVYNGERDIRESLDSLLGQEFVDFELIISDNGSTDATEQICRSYAVKDKRIKYFRSLTNQGAVWNLNNVFCKATAEYFMMASHDDYWAPQYLQSCLKVLENSSSVILTGSVCDFMDSQMITKVYTDSGISTVGLSVQRRYQEYKNYCNNNGLNSIFYGVCRRDVLAKVLPFRGVIGLDYVALNGLSLLGEFFTIQELLMKKRKGGDSTNYDSAILSLPIKNSFFVKYPNLVREYILQGMIFKSSQLGILNKGALSLWSIADFFRYSFLNRTKGVSKN